MVALIDIAGQRFGAWTVLHKATDAPARKVAYWECRCDCGTVRDVDGGRLRKGLSESCGCQAPEKIGAAHVKHGLYGTLTYRIWRGMKQRCQNPKARDYSDYGGRGIAVCERWQRFENFAADMGEAPAGMTIERKDNNAGYAPDNCRWATPEEQQLNTRRNRRVAHAGKEQTVTEWAREYGIPSATLFARLNKGWDMARALGPSKPVRVALDVASGWPFPKS